jgi:hypothetical protein
MYSTRIHLYEWYIACPNDCFSVKPPQPVTTTPSSYHIAIKEGRWMVVYTVVTRQDDRGEGERGWGGRGKMGGGKGRAPGSWYFRYMDFPPVNTWKSTSGSAKTDILFL